MGVVCGSLLTLFIGIPLLERSRWKEVIGVRIPRIDDLPDYVNNKENETHNSGVNSFTVLCNKSD